MRKKIVLACSICKARNYSTETNQSTDTRVEMKKFCKICNEHTRHLETK